MNITHELKLLTVLSRLGALVVMAVALSPPGEVTAGAEKVDVCHVTNVPEQGDGRVISIADPAWSTHEAHGDKRIDIDSGVTVDGSNCRVSQAPVAVDDTVTTPVDTPVTIYVLENDSYTDPVIVSVQVFPQKGTLGIVGTGIFEYTPNPGYVGIDSFTYQICNNAGQCDTATVTINVSP